MNDAAGQSREPDARLGWVIGSGSLRRRLRRFVAGRRGEAEGLETIWSSLRCGWIFDRKQLIILGLG